MAEQTNNSEPAKSKLSRILQFIPVLAVVVTLTGILITIASRKKELTCEYTGSTRLVAVSSSGLPADVRMDYHGEPVNSLTRLSFVIKNSGAAAIKQEDVRDSVKLVFPANVRVLNAAIDSTAPQWFEFQPKALPDSRTVEFGFPLLNSGDEASISVYIINSEAATPDFRGRIVDVPRFVFVSRTSDDTAAAGQLLISSHAVRLIIHWLLILVQGFIATVFASLAVMAVVTYIKFLPWRRKWGAKYGEIVTKLEAEYRQRNAKRVSNFDDRFAEGAEHDALMANWRSVPPNKLRQKLREANIPKHPDPMLESFFGTLAALIGFGGLAALFGFTAYLAHIALRG
ncbi:MAG TPA: hypothetical protein VN673_08880 [Clostridia bacterium]|nr:hypothetical protein [Clostridia bacterium]